MLSVYCLSGHASGVDGVDTAPPTRPLNRSRCHEGIASGETHASDHADRRRRGHPAHRHAVPRRRRRGDDGGARTRPAGALAPRRGGPAQAEGGVGPGASARRTARHRAAHAEVLAEGQERPSVRRVHRRRYQGRARGRLVDAADHPVARRTARRAQRGTRFRHWSAYLDRRPGHDGRRHRRRDPDHGLARPLRRPGGARTDVFAALARTHPLRALRRPRPGGRAADLLRPQRAGRGRGEEPRHVDGPAGLRYPPGPSGRRLRTDRRRRPAGAVRPARERQQAAAVRR